MTSRLSRLSTRIRSINTIARLIIIIVLCALGMFFYKRYTLARGQSKDDDFAYILPPPVYSGSSSIPEPIREYNPNNNQQIGILTSESGSIFPLYGKQKRDRRNRYDYYTMSSGERGYPVPLTHNGRNCTDASGLGCPEFFGDEKVSMIGSSDIYNVELYGLKNLFI